jgi:hypothetical protein
MAFQFLSFLDFKWRGTARSAGLAIVAGHSERFQDGMNGRDD